MTLPDLMWKTMKDVYRRSVDYICNEYETNSKYNLKKFFENGDLVGFAVWYMLDDYRVLEGGYYIGSNKMLFFKYWREFSKYPKLKAIVQKSNTRMIEFYKKMKFKIENENLVEFLFVRG